MATDSNWLVVMTGPKEGFLDYLLRSFQSALLGFAPMEVSRPGVIIHVG